MKSAIAALLTFLLAACAGSSSPGRPDIGRPREAAYGMRIASIVSAWESADGSSTRRPDGNRDGSQATHAVSAAWWGFDPADSTTSLQAALDSDAGIVVVPRMQSPWILSRTLVVPSGVELLLEPGVVILAAEGAFRGAGDSLVTARGATDFSILGYGATLRMRKRDYQRPPYEPAQWRHALSLRGVERARVAGLAIESSGGDGIYVGTLRGAVSPAPCQDLVLQDLDIRDNHRQGVSVISARRLLIENCRITGTAGASPGAGIDFEPNSDDPGFEDCVVRSCRIEGNAGPGMQFAFGRLGSQSGPVSIRVEDCVIHNLLVATWLHGLSDRVKGTLTFSGNSIIGLTFLRGSKFFSVSFERSR